MEPLLPPKLIHLFTVHCTVEQPLDIGQVSSGCRRWVPIVGGSVRGKYLTGEVVGGEDSMYSPFSFEAVLILMGLCSGRRKISLRM